MQYTNKLWENNDLGPIFSEMLYANNTVSKALVRVLENIKYKQTVTTISGGLTVQPYAVTPSTGASTISFDDASIEPVKSHIYHEFEMNSLRSTRFGADMKSGAANVESNEFLKAVLEWAIPQAGKAIEKDFYTKLIAELVAATGVKGIVGTTLSASNIVAEIGKVYEQIPGQVLSSSEAKIYAPEGTLPLIRQANLKQTYRDIFTIDGQDAFYLGVPVVEVPLAPNTIVAGRASDLVLGTDLASDFGAFEVAKVQANSDLMFIKATFSLDAAVCVPSQKVLYKPAA